MQVLSIENVMELSVVPKQHVVDIYVYVNCICSETNCENGLLSVRGG